MKTSMVKAAAGLVVVIGSVVLFGWLAGIPALFQVRPAYIPMHFNTALVFILTGIALFSLLAIVIALAQRFRHRAVELAQSNSLLEHEIDNRVRTARELTRVNRSLNVLSRCNMAIVHAHDEEQLLTEICAILVNPGGYRMAWIAYAENDPTVPVQRMASAGNDDGYLDAVSITWDDSPTGNGPTGTAIKTGRPAIIRNVFNDPAFVQWRERALRHGFASTIALPLTEAHGLRGTLNIYAAEADAFDAAETALLTELAGDLSFGVGALRSDSLRTKAQAALQEREAFLAEVLDSIRDGILIFDRERRVIQGNAAIREWFAADSPLQGKICCELFQKSCQTCPTGRALNERISTSETVAAADGRWLDIHAFPLHDSGVILYVRDVTEKKRTEDELVQEKHKWEAIVGAIGEGLTIQDRDFRVIYQNEVHVRRHGRHVGELCREAYGCNEEDECPLKVSFATGEAETKENRFPSGGKTLDMEVTASPLRDATGEIIAGIEIMCDITDRKRAERQIRKQLESISAMRNIDLAISATGDLRVTLNILLNHVRAQLFVDAATVLLVNPVSNTLEAAAAEGFFDPEPISRSCVPIGSGFAGKVALERRSLHQSPLKPAEVTFALQSEGFASYYALPLFSKGMVTGVLELFHRSPFVPESDWRSLAEAMAGQAGIAIDNARMFDALQRSNAGLIAAYDATIAALSRALDFRDHETEGHSRRVTEMTVRIGREMNLADEELYHIRRGALLHDIGKLAIPDHILLKPAALAAEEKIIMERHPDIAHEMLSPISFLRPALDIPYCHHEKWDGTGYPRGLKGEQIPFSARIFAAVDIWDALRSNRPYRQAWEVEKTHDYLRSIAGTHLDPDVVEVFLRMDWSSISRP